MTYQAKASKPAVYVATRTVPLDELTPFPGNAKRGDVEALRVSLRRNGQYRALVVRAVPDGPLVVLAGNHTLQALAREGLTEARCELVECDEATARRINLVDNRAAELGSYDDAALVDLLEALGEDLEGSGFSGDDLLSLLGGAEHGPATGGLTDPDEVPQPPVEPVSKSGDVWLLGPHRVLCGDSTDVAAVEGMLDGDRADCMWTDPPYGVDYVGKTKNALTIQNDGAEGLPSLLAGAFAVATAALRPGAPFYIAHPPGPDSQTFWAAVQGAGWLHRQNLVWVKDVFVLGRSDYHYQHEPIIYGFTEPEPGAGRLGRGGDRWHGDNAQTSVLDVARPKRSEDHPTMKPVELISRCLGNSCRPGGMVYEPFGGSGSTLMAAHATGRVARSVELDPRYVDVICRRFQEHTGMLPVLASSGEEHSFARG